VRQNLKPSVLKRCISSPIVRVWFVRCLDNDIHAFSFVCDISSYSFYILLAGFLVIVCYDPYSLLSFFARREIDASNQIFYGFANDSKHALFGFLFLFLI
jgi:hypothetical protein